MILLFQEQIVEKLTDTALQVSPYSAATFGFLVLSLIGAIVWLGFMYKKERSYNKALVQKIIDMNGINTESLAAVRAVLDDPIFDDIKSDIDRLSNKVSDLRSLIEYK
jgi:hypothetical protein